MSQNPLAQAPIIEPTNRANQLKEVVDAIEAHYDSVHPTLEGASDCIRDYLTGCLHYKVGGSKPEEPFSRLYGVYKYASRIKGKSSLIGKVKGEFRDPNSWKKTWARFEEHKKALLNRESREKQAIAFTAVFQDIIGARFVCFTQRQKHRVHQHLHRLALREERLSYPTDKRYWKYFNPQPRFLDSCDGVYLYNDGRSTDHLKSSSRNSVFKSVELMLSEFEEVGNNRKTSDFIKKVAKAEKTINKIMSTFLLNHRKCENVGYQIENNDYGYSTVQTVLQHNFFRFEIQVRTLLEDAWSEPEHDVVYKGGISVSSTATAQHLSASLDAADDSMQAMFDSRDMERLESIDVFVIQQSGSLPLITENERLHRDLRKLAWLQKECHYVNAFFHAQAVRLKLCDYELESEFVTAYVAILNEQALTLLFLAYMVGDENAMQELSSLYSELVAIAALSTNGKAFQFVGVFRRSLIHFWRHTLLTAGSDKSSEALESALTDAKEASEFFKDNRAEIANVLDLRNFGESPLCWYYSLECRVAARNGQEFANGKLLDSLRLEGEGEWWRLWMFNTYVFTSLYGVSQTTNDEWQSNVINLADSLAKELREPRWKQFFYIIQICLNDPASLNNLQCDARAVVQRAHLGHLKFLDTAMIYGYRFSKKKSAFDALNWLYPIVRTKTMDLELDGRASSKDYFVIALKESMNLEDRAKQATSFSRSHIPNTPP